MKKRRISDAWLAVGILALLFGVIVAGALLAPNQAALPALSSHSTQKDGSQALYVWLEQLGYQVSNTPGCAFVVPEGTQVVFLLEPHPTLPVQANEWEELDQFVEDGGTLISAGDGLNSASVADHYGFSIEQAGYNSYIVPLTPVLHSPPLDFSKISILTFNHLVRSKFDYLPVLVEKNHPYAVSLPKGKGQVILVADSALFSNKGLKKYGAAQLLLNLLTPIPPGVKVWFDEWHHGEHSLEMVRNGPGDWLLHTAGGQAVLWVLLVVFVGLVLEGRYFGRPLAAEKNAVRRAPLEYVNALAGLNQRAGHRREILGVYYYQLKRSLSQRFRIDPNLPDDETLRILSESHPEIDPPALLALFKRLKRAHPSEQELVELAHQAAELTRKIEQSSSGPQEGTRGKKPSAQANS
jgi:hypothetical protein